MGIVDLETVKFEIWKEQMRTNGLLEDIRLSLLCVNIMLLLVVIAVLMK